MDYLKLIQLIHSKPVLWDRCNSNFREIKFKQNAWQEIATAMGKTASSCRDGFKHLREKYVREREKVKTFKGIHSYTPWELFPYLSFLDNQIIPRKKLEYIQINGEGSENIDEIYYSATVAMEKNSNHSWNEFPMCSTSNSIPKEKQTNESLFPLNFTTVEDILEAEKLKISHRIKFDKILVDLVRQSSQLWDWKHPDFSNKQLRAECWEKIANKLDKTPSECGLKWKSLREKYLREKMKHRDENKRWELLDDMSFLDGIIQYRGTKNPHGRESSLSTTPTEKKDNNIEPKNFLFGGESSSCGDYHLQVISKDNSLYHQDSSMEIKQETEDIPDSSYDSEGSMRKRRTSEDSGCLTKKQKEEKSPEELFGELVASLLLRKNENERQMAMVEIMKVLAK